MGQSDTTCNWYSKKEKENGTQTFEEMVTDNFSKTVTSYRFKRMIKENKHRGKILRNITVKLLKQVERGKSLKSKLLQIRIGDDGKHLFFNGHCSKWSSTDQLSESH